MKKNFKLFALIFAAFTMILSGCGSKDTTEDNSDSGKKKALRVVTAAEYAPFEYIDKGEVVGFDVDLIKAVGEEAGYEINVEHVGWDPIFVEIDAKRADLAVAAITINDDRKQTYDFSKKYFLSTNMILVKNDSAIKNAADLQDKKVAVQNGTTGQEAIEKLFGQNNPNLKKFDNIPLAIMELKGGGVDAVVADNTVVEEYVKNNPKDKLKVIDDEAEFVPEFYGFLYPKGSKLKAELDDALTKIMENGKYTEIYSKWFGVEPNIEKLTAN